MKIISFIFKFIFLPLLLGTLSHILINSTGFGELVGERFSPEGVELAKWAFYITNMFSITLAIALITYFLYTHVLYKFPRIDNFKKPFNLRKPWLRGMIILFVLQFSFGIVVGLVMIAKKNYSVIISLVGFAGFCAIIGIILYWIASIFYSPPKVKYAPKYRHMILSAFQK
ncbi:hypothetical protein LCGC14_2590480 [marine sediment metagenome]|uniref:Uncharacterized protein n=1 Tax=marine sediment metagenome TaxID=412755 RepID=A0A0F9D4I5_9ZZZZ|nr:hypothetical protein [Candidatus Aminicenantes bacterium]